VAASQCGQEVVYLRWILCDFGFIPIGPTQVYDIRRYFVRDLVAQNVLKLIPLRTSLMVADALTKSLPAPAHAKHRNVMIGRVPFSVRTLCPSHCVLGG
jgi:hypothetical protein